MRVSFFCVSPWDGDPQTPVGWRLIALGDKDVGGDQNGEAPTPRKVMLSLLGSRGPYPHATPVQSTV